MPGSSRPSDVKLDYPEAVRAVIQQLKRLPGIGSKSAEHMAVWLLQQDRSTIDDFAASLQQTEQTTMAAMGGEADPQALVEALAQTKLAVETAVTVRDKVVEAYNQILRMPV